MTRMIVVIPAYEPDEKLLRVVAELKRDTDYAIVVVNDGSSEAAEPVFAALPEGVTLLRHAQNRGKGRALKTAYEYIAAHFPQSEGIVTVDADGQHLPADVVRVSEDWEAHPEALVLGSRRFTGTVPWRSRAGNAITRVVFRLSTGVSVYDTQTGLRAFAVSSIPMMLEMRGERYEYEINVLLYATRQHMPIREVTIETVYIADNASSHFHPMRDSWRIYKMILLFAASSLLAAAVDYVLVLSLSALFAKQAQGLLWSVVLARVISSFLNYMLNRKLVFEDCSRRSVFRYYLVAAGIMAANYGLLSLISGVMPLALAKLLVELALYPLSFYLQRRFVFARGERIS
ncbi:MAG: bifunctional glycosyltransferase family 2/GtrA family protein [Christensenellaceae bacterium]|nr:bifunctional glycosyltransferase family 2/GtrA family protein [Christensenellaceae bacterium]PWM61269.1 MAG: sugar translocase [Clostridia bacterium]